MTDLEMVKKCALKMGFDPCPLPESIAIAVPNACAVQTDIGVITYDPLTNDAQAMALVKRFDLSISKGDFLHWNVNWYEGDGGATPSWWEGNKDLNRAICECVAKLPD